MFARNLSKSKRMSLKAMQMTNSDAFVLRNRFRRITIIVSVLPIVPNIKQKSSEISPKSQGRGDDLAVDSLHDISEFVIFSGI